MNLRDLMTKLDTISEAGAPVVNPYKTPEDRAKFDSLSPEDQEWYSRPVSDGNGGMRPGMPDLNDPYIAMRAPNKGKAVSKPPVTPVSNKPTDPGQDPTDANMVELDKLRDQLLSSLGGQGAMPSTDTDTDTVTNPVTPHVAQEKEKTLGQKAGVGAGIAAGALGGAALGKKYGGKFGALAGGLTGGALGGMGVNALQKESAESDSSIAQALTESFGYDFEDAHLDEYSMDQFGKDAGDFGRGAWNGVTLGTGDNIAAGVQSAFGSDTYKQALAKQTAASKEAETRSPALYTAGNIAGSIAVPVPGGAIAGGLIKGASTAAKVARGGVALGTNLAAQQGVNMVKNASDTKTLGYDPSKYPTTPQEIMAFQKANGLTPDGKVGPKTTAVLSKMGLKPVASTVAEDIKSIQDKLAMIETGQWRLEEDADYSVWLLEDGTVIGEQGEIITDEAILSEVDWSALAGNAVKGAKSLGSKVVSAAKDLKYGMQKPGEVAALVKGGAAGKFSPANIGSKIGANPAKAGLAAGAALGAGAVAAANTSNGSAPMPSSDTGSSSGTPAATTAAADTDSSTASTSTATGDLTPEQKEIIAKMQKIIQGVGATEDEGLLSHIAPATAAIQKATQSASAKTATSGQAASPAGTTTSPTQTLNIPKVPAGTTVDAKGQVTESEDELARWLRIARG